MRSACQEKTGISTTPAVFKAAKKNSELHFLPLGGTGEIGMNMYLYGLGQGRKTEWLMVDCGVKFGDEADPGIDVILPDIRFIEDRQMSLRGIVITHAHEDHIGAIPWLWERLRAPIYCTPFAGELIRNKLLEADLLNQTPLHIVPLGGMIEVGGFQVEFVSVTHSIPEPNAIVLRTSAGTVVHSGDFKIDPTPSIPPRMNETRLKEIGAEGVDVLVCDSTNVLRHGFSPSEQQVSQALEEIIGGAKKRVMVTTFASHIGRITGVIEAARAHDRDVVICGRAMHKVMAAAREVGLLDGITDFVPEEEFGLIPRAKILVICTGSQGEMRASMARIASDTHPNISLDRGDLAIFSSKTIPGNEKAVGKIHNALAGQGVQIVTSDDALVHSSGHPRRDELQLIYEWLKPAAVVPMHGEVRHLSEHAKFALEAGVPQSLMAVNGDLVRLLPGPLEIIEEIEVDRLHVDGHLILPAAQSPARRRRKLSFHGTVFVSLVINEQGHLEFDPLIVLEGLPELDGNGEAMDEGVLAVIEETLEDMPRKRRCIDEVVCDSLRIAIRRWCDATWGKRPVCHIVIHRG